MRTKALLGTTIVALTLALAACSTGGEPAAEEPMTAPTSSESESMPEAMAEPMDELEGSFAGLNDQMAEGTVTIEGDSLTLAGFSSSEGPDLHLYLANGTDEASVDAGMELGEVAWDEASQTFSLAGVDASEFSHVIVHCDMANAVFGAAEIA